MNERGIQGILSEMRADIAGIEEDTRKQVEALREQGEENKARCMAMGNKALQSAVINDLAPKHEQFKFAVKKIDTNIGELLGQLLALEHNRIKTPEEIEKESDSLCVDLSFLRFARGIAESANTKRSDLMKELGCGIRKGNLDWYNDPKNSRSTYYSVLTIDESLRDKEEGDFLCRYGGSRIVPVLYLGKETNELEGERPGEWKTDQDRSKVIEMIDCKLAEFTEEGLIPPVSIRLYPELSYDYDFTYSFESPFNMIMSHSCFIVAVEAECF